MKHVIYVMRHQRPGKYTGNCVDAREIQDTKSLCERIRPLEVRNVIACAPGASKHIRPLQTASNLCSCMDCYLEVCENVHALPNFIHGNTLIVWHHSDMEAILNHFGFPCRFEWPDDDYDGCIVINEHGWGYDARFFSATRCDSCLAGWW